MSNDLLPLPDILAESPKETGYDGEATGPAANGSGHRLLADYPNFDPRPQAVGTIGSLDAPACDGLPEHGLPDQAPNPSADGLTAVAVTVRQVESILQINSSSAAPDVHFAVERIQDLAMALRMREVDAALCDALDAAIREIGDAIVDNDAAVTRAQSAVALVRELARRIDNMSAPDPQSAGRIYDGETGDHVASGSNDAAPRPPAAYAVHGFVSDDDHARSLLQPAFVHPALPETRTSVETKKESAEPAKPIALSIPSPLGENIEIESEQANSRDAEAAASAAVGADIPGIAVPYNGHVMPTPSYNGHAMPAPSYNSQATPPVVTLPPPAEKNVAATANAAVSPNDPLAALYVLSEEELIALFS